MSGFELHIDQSLAALRELLGETAQQHSRHQQLQPGFSPSASGRGFSVQGEALADMFEGLHRGVEKRIDAFTYTTEAARNEVTRFAETDQEFGAVFEGMTRS